MSNILSAEQREQFIRDGYVVVSGLVPEEIINETREKLCEAMGLSLTDSSTWPTEERMIPFETAELTNGCRTEKMDDAVEELVGDFLLRGQCISSVLDIQGKDPYIKGFLPVIAFPREGEKRFDAENHNGAGYHIDGIHFTTLWPAKILMVAMVYLHDVESYGGATVVSPGSHRLVFEHWQSRGELPEWKEIMADLDYPAPVAIAGKAGDVVFMHYLAVHSGSPNYDNKVRLAINANFTSDPQKAYEVKSGPPTDEWTPLDYTLRTDNIHTVASA
jgi:hypothetical protein